MAKRVQMICLHKLNGHPFFVHVGAGGEAKLLLSKKPVVVETAGKVYKVRESRKEIEALVEEVS